MQMSFPGSGIGGSRLTSGSGVGAPVWTPSSGPAASSARRLGAFTSSTSSPRRTAARGPWPASYVTSRTPESLNPLHNRDSAGGQDAYRIPRVHPVAARLLGGVERSILPRIEIVEVDLLAGAHSHARADRHLERLGTRPLGCRPQPLGDLRCLLQAHARQQHDELLAAEPVHQVEGPQ